MAVEPQIKANNFDFDEDIVASEEKSKVAADDDDLSVVTTPINDEFFKESEVPSNCLSESQLSQCLLPESERVPIEAATLDDDFITPVLPPNIATKPPRSAALSKIFPSTFGTSALTTTTTVPRAKSSKFCITGTVTTREAQLVQKGPNELDKFWVDIGSYTKRIASTTALPKPSIDFGLKPGRIGLETQGLKKSSITPKNLENLSTEGPKILNAILKEVSTTPPVREAEFLESSTSNIDISESPPSSTPTSTSTFSLFSTPSTLFSLHATVTTPGTFSFITTTLTPLITAPLSTTSMGQASIKHGSPDDFPRTTLILFASGAVIVTIAIIVFWVFCCRQSSPGDVIKPTNTIPNGYAPIPVEPRAPGPMVNGNMASTPIAPSRVVPAVMVPPVQREIGNGHPNGILQPSSGGDNDILVFKPMNGNSGNNCIPVSSLVGVKVSEKRKKSDFKEWYV